MKLRTRNHVLLSIVIAAALGGSVVAEAVAQPDRSERSGKNAKVEVLYPEASRKAPEAKPSSKAGPKLQKMIDAYNKEDFAKARTLADEILATAGTNAYDKSLAAQIASQCAYNSDDNAAAKAYLKQVLQFDGLDNNGHYQSMLMLAQLELQDEQWAEGTATLDQYLAETKSQRPQDLIIKGQALYQQEKYKEAIPVLEQAMASPEAKDNWRQILMACYAEAGEPQKAVALAEKIAAASPDDKKAQINLASLYLQNEQMDKAAAIMEKLRAAGQLTDEREYKQLYSTYANMDGHEKDVIAVIDEGIRKGILKPDYQVYLALAQSYYYSEPPQIAKAIDAWQKAAPLSKDGETYLNLAKVLWQEGRIPEARQAARQALDKGVRNPADAKKIINLK